MSTLKDVDLRLNLITLDGALCSGGAVRGTLVALLPHGKHSVKLQDATVTLSGVAHVRAEDAEGSSSGKEDEMLLNITTGNLLQAEGAELYPDGEIQLPFLFQLPPYLPANLDGWSATIKYMLTATSTGVPPVNLVLPMRPFDAVPPKMLAMRGPCVTQGAELEMRYPDRLHLGANIRVDVTLRALAFDGNKEELKLDLLLRNTQVRHAEGETESSSRVVWSSGRSLHNPEGLLGVFSAWLRDTSQSVAGSDAVPMGPTPAEPVTSEDTGDDKMPTRPDQGTKAGAESKGSKATGTDATGVAAAPMLEEKEKKKEKDEMHWQVNFEMPRDTAAVSFDTRTLSQHGLLEAQVLNKEGQIIERIAQPVIIAGYLGEPPLQLTPAEAASCTEDPNVKKQEEQGDAAGGGVASATEPEKAPKKKPLQEQEQQQQANRSAVSGDNLQAQQPAEQPHAHTAHTEAAAHGKPAPEEETNNPTAA